MLLGPGTFDAATSELRLLDGFALAGPRLDVWRAPTDNDLGAPGSPNRATACCGGRPACTGCGTGCRGGVKWRGGRGGRPPLVLTPGRCPAGGRAAARRR